MTDKTMRKLVAFLALLLAGPALINHPNLAVAIDRDLSAADRSRF